jgi:branched-chain amino acid transport system substrate-binding protein
MSVGRCYAGIVVMIALATAAPNQVTAQKKYDPGASDTEIKIGNIMPYSGPASSYSAVGKAMAAYFDKINAEGGIHGRRLNFVSRDDGYQPPKLLRLRAD